MISDEEIIEMASRVGFTWLSQWKMPACTTNHILELGRLIAEKQKEIDLGIIAQVRLDDGDGQHTQWYAGVDECAEEIRSQK